MLRANFWARRRLETRIGTAIVLAIAALLALALFQLTVVHRPEYIVFQSEWLTKAIVQVLAVAEQVPAADRNAELAKLPASQYLDIMWSQQENPGPRHPRPPLPQLDGMFGGDLRTALRDRAKSVSIRFGGPNSHGPRSEKRRPPFRDGSGEAAAEGLERRPPPPPSRLPFDLPYRLTVVPPQEQSESRPQTQDVVPAIFDIHVELNDGTWLHVLPKHHARSWRMDVPILLLAGALVVVALSVWTARRTLAPLSALTAAAKRLGFDRTQSPISTTGLNEFTPIAEALNEMHARLSKYVEERTQMLAAISHDMRTSLTRLSLSIEDVAEPALKAQLSREIAEMTSMISATLVFAQNDSQVEPSTDVDVAALLISLTDEASDAGHPVAFHGPDHLTLHCQRLVLKRAFTNLIENAVKYGGDAMVTLQQDEAGASIEIADKGPGIPVEEREKAFQPFYRLEGSRNRSTGGVGLGLTIARDAVHAHGGSITLGEVAGGGLLVRVVLPSG